MTIREQIIELEADERRTAREREQIIAKLCSLTKELEEIQTEIDELELKEDDAR